MSNEDPTLTADSPPFESAALPDVVSVAKKSYYPALDGFRAIAVLLVFSAHYANFAWGWTGVNFFFVLSGFLITGILYDARNQRHRFRNFYVRRTLRIFPLYYGVFAILLITTPLFHWQWSTRWLLWPCYLGNFSLFTYLPVIRENGSMGALSGFLGAPFLSRPAEFHLVLGHFWSLCVEEQFYLLWPLVVFTVGRRVALMRICAVVVIALPFVRWGFDAIHKTPPLPGNFLFGITFFQVDALLLGGLIALYFRGDKAPNLRLAASGIAYAIVAAAGLGVFYEHFVKHVSYPWNVTPSWVFTFGLTLVNLFAGSIILLSLHRGFFLNRILLLRPLRRLGQVSYGFYVFHAIPITLYGSFVSSHLHHLQRTTSALLSLLCTSGLALLSYRYFESPFLRMKDRWTR
jgi:peptidoglycan/LPS O-acetylase OafA/YrhL